MNCKVASISSKLTKGEGRFEEYLGSGELHTNYF
jgi:hypothetical protein